VFDLGAVLVINHNRERQLAKALALHAHRRKSAAQLGDRSLFRVIDQLVFRAGVLLILKVGDETGLGVVVVPSARRNLFAGLGVVYRMPLGDDVEVCRDVEQAIEDQWPGLAGKLLKREDPEIVVVHAQIATMGFQLRAAHLPVEMTRPAQRRITDFGGAEVYETPDKPESPFRP
jgi:hypothetical protein